MKSFFIGSFSGVLLSSLILAVFVDYQFKAPLHVLSQNKVFRIIPGQGVKEIAAALEKNGIVENYLPFYWYTKVFQKDRDLKAGAYKLSASFTIKELVALFEKGSNASLRVTFPEGFTLKQDLQRLQDSGFALKEEDFLTISDELKNRHPFLRSFPQTASLEGVLFPDTYTFPLDASVAQIQEAFVANFEKQVVSHLLDTIEQKGYKLFDVIIMASILEKELKTYEDKSIASGILWRRILFGVPLQVDATVNYATGKSLPAVGYDDLAIDSLYNTYKYNGLPPGSISNPGLESFKAAMLPKESDYWFYLSRQDTGESIFSTTLKEHNIAKAKYLE